MVRAGLAGALRRALHRATRERRAIRTQGVRASASGKNHVVNMDVVPLGNAGQRHYLILFGDTERPDAIERPAAEIRRAGGDGEATRLTRELADTRQQLQTSLDEQQATNEELRAAVEEAQSANEELQSTNEELETAKEELQATNEELTTVNDELNSRNQTLNQLGSDLTNLLHSIHVPILMVGADHRIRRITPVAERILSVAPSDVGRPLTELRLSIDVSNLEELITAATTTLVPQEREIEARDGRWYVVRVRPYRTAEDRIDGVVVSFVDIDTLRRSLAQAKYARDEAQAIVETVREPLVVLDDQLRVILANRAFYTMFQVASGQTEGRTIFELGNRQWDIPALRRLLEEVLPEDRVLENFEMEHRFEAIGLRMMRLNARRMRAVGDHPTRILLAIEDVTDTRRYEATQEQLRQEQVVRAEAEAATRAKDRFLAVLSHELRTPLNAMLGWTRMLRSNRLDPPTAARGLEVIERNVLAQARLIEDLLDVSRIIAGHLRLDARPVTVAPIVRTAVAAMQPTAQAKGVSLRISLDERALGTAARGGIEHDVDGLDADHLHPEPPGRRAGEVEPEHGKRGRRRARTPEAHAHSRPDRVAPRASRAARPDTEPDRHAALRRGHASGNERLRSNLDAAVAHQHRPLHAIALGADLDAETVLGHPHVRRDGRPEGLALRPIRKRARAPCQHREQGQGDRHARGRVAGAPLDAAGSVGGTGPVLRHLAWTYAGTAPGRPDSTTKLRSVEMVACGSRTSDSVRKCAVMRPA